MALLKVSDLEWVTPSGHLLLKIDALEVCAGESVAVIGPNGAGKTTLFDVVSGLLEASKGDVVLSGEDLGGMVISERAKRVAYLKQGTAPLFDFSVYEFVEMAFYVQGPRHKDEERTRIVAELEKMSVAHLLNRRITTLSSGEYQRVRMARQGLSPAPLWLLDEPTSNLDPRHKLQLLGRVAEHCATDSDESKKMDHTRPAGAALCVVHDLGLVEQFFSRVILLKGGRVVADGATGEVLTVESLSELYETKIVYDRCFLARP